MIEEVSEGEKVMRRKLLVDLEESFENAKEVS
jgi:hypothetical protein